MCQILALCMLLLLSAFVSLGSRIKIVNNGYEELLVALPSEVQVQDRIRLVLSLENLFQHASSLLSDVTRGRAFFRSVVFLVPYAWIETLQQFLQERNATDAGADLVRNSADVVVTDDDYPYTLHQGGCGRKGLRIYFPRSMLQSGSLHDQGMKFIQLWSELRYGVFPEGGFADDEMYPLFYYVPGEFRNRTTGCRKPPLRSLDETEKEENCQEKIPCSIMDQRLKPVTGAFCEGEMSLGLRHDAIAPSKQNLLCKEEGAWFTVLRSPDFKNGRNAPKRNNTFPKIAFRYVKEMIRPQIIVVIDASSRMRNEGRYDLTKNAFAHFLLLNVPDGSELTLLVFGETDSDKITRMITSSVLLENERAKIRYLETDPLPEEPFTSDENVNFEEVLNETIQIMFTENKTFTSTPNVVLVTSHLEVQQYENVRQYFYDAHFNILAFTKNHPENISQSIYDLCVESGSRFVNLEGDLLSNLYRGFAESIKGLHTSLLIHQEYLITLDEEYIWTPFVVDKSLTGSLEVSLSGPQFGNPLLEYESTSLQDPNGTVISPVKQQLLPAWLFRLQNAEAGEYIVKTRRKYKATSPVLVTVMLTPKPTEDRLTASMWIETINSIASPLPVQIFAEVRQGTRPVRNATVVAYVHHPESDEISEVLLVDDGIGSVDVTKEDGLYSYFFTNFTTVGFYNVYLKISGGFGDTSTVLKGPVSPCCGSFLSWDEQTDTGQFQRIVGPVTFRVTSLPDTDIYPPARVTDLKVTTVKDQMAVLQWSAVGNNLADGVALAYELKLFHDRSILHNRFSDAGLELYSEFIEIIPEATYGTILHQQVNLPKTAENGVYYFSIRALDAAGIAGEPSNYAMVYLNSSGTLISTDCKDEPIAEEYGAAVNVSPGMHLVLLILVFVRFFFIFKI